MEDLEIEFSWKRRELDKDMNFISGFLNNRNDKELWIVR